MALIVTLLLHFLTNLLSHHVIVGHEIALVLELHYAVSNLFD